MKQLIRLLNRLLPAQRPLRGFVPQQFNAQRRNWGYPGWHL
jgi:hypothetical protein